MPTTTVDVDRAVRLGKAALDAAADKGTRAEAFYALGRAHHAMGQFVDAGISYRSCLTLRGDFAPAIFGSAQVATAAKRGEEAATQLRRVLALRPEDRSACRASALLQMQAHALDEAQESARRAYDTAPGDAGAAALYATLLARQDALAAIARAFRVMESAGERAARAGRGSTCQPPCTTTAACWRCGRRS